MLVPVYASPLPAIRKIELDRPWQWLVKGWQDMRTAPLVSFTYGVLAAVTGYVLTLRPDLGGHALSRPAADGGISDRRARS